MFCKIWQNILQFFIDFNSLQLLTKVNRFFNEVHYNDKFVSQLLSNYFFLPEEALHFTFYGFCIKWLWIAFCDLWFSKALFVLPFSRGYRFNYTISSYFHGVFELAKFEILDFINMRLDQSELWQVLNNWILLSLINIINCKYHDSMGENVRKDYHSTFH